MGHLFAYQMMVGLATHVCERVKQGIIDQMHAGTNVPLCYQLVIHRKLAEGMLPDHQAKDQGVVQD